MEMIKKIFSLIKFTIVFVSLIFNLKSQTVLINSATQGGFESGSGFAINGWVVVNGTQTNKWFCNTPGNPATPFAGSNCAYISNNASGTTYNYAINNASVVHFYRDVTIPAGEPYLNLQFRYKGQGESSFDYIQVFSIPTTTTPVAGTELTSGQIGSTYYNLTGAWTLANINFCGTPGTTIRLVFSWRNDGSVGTQPPGAIDNIHLTSSSTSPPCNLGAGVTTVASLPYSSGSGTTCGSVNDLTSSNTTVCGSSLYLGGEDRVWTFTPSSSGNITINLTSSGSYTGLMLYDGCPLTGSCTSSGSLVCCVASATSSSGNKSINFCAKSGVTYYLILDSYPSPTCNAYSNLTISAPSGTCAPNEECIQAITVCSNSSFSGGTSGIGCSQELNSGNQGCLSVEYNSNWYVFSPSTSGTIAFTIAPSGSQDYDFAVWGPYSSGSTTSSVCPPSGTPLRCSFAAGSGNTGLGNGATDFTEGASGDKWVAPITATAGQVYVLLIDNFTADGAPFNFTWTGTATMNCTVLPVELIHFDGFRKNEINIINWKTLSETNNDFFILERSEDGENYYEIAKVKGAGTSNIENTYTYNDYNTKSNTEYYRLKQVDFDGSYYYSNPIAISDNDISEIFLLNIYPNPASNEFYLDFLSNSNDDIVITITDMFGKKLKSIEQNLSIGNNKLVVSTDKIDSGVLFVNISSKQNNNINITQKIVKQ